MSRQLALASAIALFATAACALLAPRMMASDDQAITGNSYVLAPKLPLLARH
ncbi:hypothetical protein [Novosphingobium umbonatum]|uniref:hypothetical protein n=1 Tax=Novosphingobium umbonatum TaxID=1908524 RepID=UPI0013E3211F|nr:hypothetical protein [Novosphingobium umbonatum]